MELDTRSDDHESILIEELDSSSETHDTHSDFEDEDVESDIMDKEHST